MNPLPPPADELPLEGGAEPRNVVRFDLGGFPEISNRPRVAGECLHRRPQLDRRLRRIVCGQCGVVQDLFETVCDLFDQYVHVENRIAELKGIEARLNERARMRRLAQSKDKRQKQTLAEQQKAATAFCPPVPVPVATGLFGAMKSEIANRQSAKAGPGQAEPVRAGQSLVSDNLVLSSDS